MRISVCGCIGAGKTSALQALAEEFPGAAVFPEPVDQWEELLCLFYKDKHAWALPLSLKVLLSFGSRLSAAATDNICFVERSPLCCRDVFTKMLHADGILSQPAWELFLEYWSILGWKPDAIIFIDTPAAVCLERIEKRGRTSENSIDIQYAKRLEFYYAQMLRTMEQEGLRVKRVSGNGPQDVVNRAVIHSAKELLEVGHLST